MYPSERYAYLLEIKYLDIKERITDYVDESYHQGITLKELKCRTWREVINALLRYEYSHIYSERHVYLLNDYKLYLESQQ